MPPGCFKSNLLLTFVKHYGIRDRAWILTSDDFSSTVITEVAVWDSKLSCKHVRIEALTCCMLGPDTLERQFVNRTFVHWFGELLTAIWLHPLVFSIRVLQPWNSLVGASCFESVSGHYLGIVSTPSSLKGYVTLRNRHTHVVVLRDRFFADIPCTTCAHNLQDTRFRLFHRNQLYQILSLER